MAIIKLVDVAKYYKDLKHQNDALCWLDSSTGEQKQKAFARIYRNKGLESNVQNVVTEEPDIDFRNAFKYFEGTAWQVNAMNFLQANTDEKILNEFARLWRLAPTPKLISNNYKDYWQQMTHYGTRVPISEVEKLNIEKACKMLLDIEKQLGVALTLTSGFRPEPINSKVGGVPGSQHTFGRAADVYSDSMDDYELEREIVKYWYQERGQAVGRGQHSGRGFTHVDCRGYPALWDY